MPISLRPPSLATLRQHRWFRPAARGLAALVVLWVIAWLAVPYGDEPSALLPVLGSVGSRSGAMIRSRPSAGALRAVDLEHLDLAVPDDLALVLLPDLD